MTEERKTPNMVTEKIPDKFIEKINALKSDLQNIDNEFFSLSVELVTVQERLSVLKKQRDSKKESFNATMKLAAGKLQLAKKTNYNWRYDGQEGFIGVEVPKPPETKGEGV